MSNIMEFWSQALTAFFLLFHIFSISRTLFSWNFGTRTSLSFQIDVSRWIPLQFDQIVHVRTATQSFKHFIFPQNWLNREILFIFLSRWTMLLTNQIYFIKKIYKNIKSMSIAWILLVHSLWLISLLQQ